jgi:mono/diheme cytochrome c family protein
MKMDFRRFRFVVSAPVAALLLFALFARPASAQKKSTPGPADKDASVYAALAAVPPKARAKENPLKNDTEAPIAGKKLFEQHCAECHGNMAEGADKGPSLRTQNVQQATPGTLFWILTNGVVRQGMPVWSKLPEPERWQIVAFVRSLGTSAP